MVCIVIRSSCHGPMPGELDKGFLCDLSQILGSKQVSMGKNSDPLEENQLSSQSTKHPVSLGCHLSVPHQSAFLP